MITPVTTGEIKQSAETQAIIKLVDQMVSYAHAKGVSDIHIDPAENSIRVRMRIDGVLQNMFALPKNIHNEIISRIKVLAQLRIDEHSAPQDGRFRVAIPERGSVDIRVSIAPTYHGENAVLRLLAEHAEGFTLERHGFSERDREKILKAVKKSSGMILVTGPTGSGKTTTLYTLVKMLNTDDVSIITIEDPIEYSVSGIEQIQVNAASGLTFANGLRSVLRQDPNIIMVGEIRDTDTATIAVNTALTGHLLLSTLHTNDAATTLPRLLDMRIEPYLVASTVSLVIGQRLVRRLCSSCREEYEPSEAERKSLADALPAGALEGVKKLYRGKGCDACGTSGFSGRLGINEVLVMDNDIREAILRKCSASEIKKIAVKNGMTPLILDGCAKAIAGLTSVSEVLRVIHE